MITIELSAQALGATRYALSPLMELATVVNQWRPDRCSPLAAAAKDALVGRELWLLTGFMTARGRYVPDFLNPLPSGYDADLDHDLHQVATTAPEQIAAEMAQWLGGRPAPSKAARAVLTCLDAGEPAFAHRVADELARFWSAFLAPRWPSIRRRLEADVDRRAAIASREGFAAVLGSLHGSVRWRPGGVQIARPSPSTRHEASGLVLFPSAIAVHAGVGIDPLCGRPAHLVYPAVAGDQRRPPPLGDVLGHTRSALLLDLDLPRTTSELARRHHLSPSTVSYHLGRLHRAGLVTRTREGAEVRYRLATSIAGLA